MERKTTAENTSRTADSKVKRNPLTVAAVIVAAIVFVLIFCCVASGFASSFGAAINRMNIEKQVEDSLDDIQPTQIPGVDTNADKTKTQPIPSDLPSEGKNLIPSSWGNPYNVNKSTGSQNQFTLLFSVKGQATSLAKDAENNLKRLKWTTTTNVDPETEATIVTGNKTVSGVTYTVNIRVQQTEDSDITFVLNY